MLVAGLIALVTGKIAEVLYHEETPETRGFEVAVEEGETPGTVGAPAQEEAPVDLKALMAAASSERGKEISKKCLTCHTFEKGGANKVGPNLWGVLGNKQAHKDDFTYSKAFYALQGGWDYDNLYAYLKNPKQFVPGNKMAFAGIKKPQEIADVLAFIREQSDQKLPLP